VGKIDLALASNGALLNMKFLPSFFEGDDALDSFVMLLRVLRVEIPTSSSTWSAALRASPAGPEQFRSRGARGRQRLSPSSTAPCKTRSSPRPEFDET
jgi:hypothetical protein